MLVYLKVNKYVETVNNMYRHFYKTEYQDIMRPIFNQSTRFFATNLIRLKRLIFKTSNLDQYLTKLALIHIMLPK